MKNISVFRRLGFKTTVLISLVAFLPMFIGIYYLFRSTESYMEKKAQNDLELLAKSTEKELCRFMCSCIADIKILVDNEIMKSLNMSVDKKLSEMKKIQNYYKRFEDITMVNGKGRVIASTTYNYRGEWKSKKWFQEAMKGNIFVSDAYIILDPYEIVVAIGVPLRDESGRIQAALVGKLNMERLWDIVDNINIGKTGFVSIVNGQHYFVSHPDKGNLFQYAPFDTDKQFGIVYNVGAKSETLIYSAVRCVGRFGCMSSNWRIIVAQERWDSLYNLWRLKYNVGYILIIGIFAVIIASIMVSRRVVKPIHDLIREMRKVSGGELSHRIEIKNKSEFGLLAASFNDMTMRLDKRRQEVQEKTRALEEAIEKINELNITLGKKVEERTRELEEKQHQLLQSSKLAAVGQLGAGVAHELNNPMSGILGYAQFMLEMIDSGNLKTEDIHTFKKYLQHIENGARRCKEIVMNLLGFTRKSTENFESLNVNKVISDTLSLIEHQLLLNKVKVVKDLDDNVKQVDGKASQLQQVFTNLIVNAQQAMSEGGQLFISTRNVEGGVKIEFMDTGCGIPEEYKSRLFEPFFTTKIDWKGTGLGLSICYDIIKNHNGNITVKSHEGEGTAFTITLPITDISDE